MKKTSLKTKIMAGILSALAVCSLSAAAVSAVSAVRADSKTSASTVKFESFNKNDIVGTWTYNVGSNYMSIHFNADGKAFIAANELARTAVGSWTIKDGMVKLTVYGGDSFYNFKNGMLINADAPAQFFTKDNNAPGAGLNKADVVGKWTYNVGSSYMIMHLESDGTAIVNAKEFAHAALGSWTVEDGKVKLTVYGGDSFYEFRNGMLFNAEAPAQFFTKDSAN